ncbi:OsmC family protein [Nitrosospira sp. NpAV]|uniref:OsmC family protein n=1 Tax=Nitrosospira sp. NpAV TaxID=58133 RepID=UPI00069628E0|nr:OsmC family protein [Nitrosospira sp. NpAV]
MTMKRVNGIDLDRLHATRDLIQADADGFLATPQYESTIVWDNAYHTISCVTGGQEIIGDEPERYGGSGAGLAPQDLLLTAVGNCLAATYVGGLSAAGIAVKSLRLNVSGRVNFRAAYGLEATNSGFDSIRIRVDIQTDSSPDKVEGILDKLLKTAPIPDTIIRPVPLNVEIACKQTELAAELS